MTQACTPKPLLDFVRGRRELLDHPLLWTLKHLELLGCHFDDLETSAYSESAPRDSKGTGDAEALARRLLLLGEGRKLARTRHGSHFYFQGRPIHRPSYIAFYRRETPLDNSSPPLVGYIHYTDINGDRIDHCEGLARASRVPGRCQKLLGLTTPRDWTKDPYFLFILLALAQRQRSCLLVTHVLDQESILLCEAVITTDLLNALANVKTAVIPITWPTIHLPMIPYKPYDTFAGRLRDELVASSPMNFPEHVNDATSYEIKRCQGMDDGKDNSGPRKIRRTLDT
ncbi:hypothetical protein BDV06DRAFT_214246 [Aspergillus oleicola]